MSRLHRFLQVCARRSSASFLGADVVQAALVPLEGLKVDEEQPSFIERSLFQLLGDVGLAL